MLYGQQERSLELLEKGVDICIKLDMYVIIDWHVLNPRATPSKYTNEAKSFFETVSKRYAKYPNVIYEICNEPNGGASWSSNIKPYAEKIIPVIRKNCTELGNYSRYANMEPGDRQAAFRSAELQECNVCVPLLCGNSRRTSFKCRKLRGAGIACICVGIRYL